MTFNEYLQQANIAPSILVAGAKFKQSMLEYFEDGELKLIDQKEWEPYWDFYYQGVQDAFGHAV